MNNKRWLAVALWLTALTGLAQTARLQQIEQGGTGAYSSVVVADSTCPRFTIYRPRNLQAAVEGEGKLPVILYANGGCADNNLEIRYFLSEIASHGYVAIAIGPYDEDDFFGHWRRTLQWMRTDGKQVVMANGEAIEPADEAELTAREQLFRKQMEEQLKKEARERKKAGKGATAALPAQATYPRMLLEALDWLIDQNANPLSEYYHRLNLNRVAAMGQSCGGAQVLGVAHDPRLSTCVLLNSGIGDMEMQGVTREALNSLHTPMLYLIGGPTDVAYPNAEKDFERIGQQPVAMINTRDGHLGTYYEKHGGAYAVATLKWLDWQLKGRIGQAALFLDADYAKRVWPDWTVVSKHF